MSERNEVYWVNIGMLPANVGFCPNKKAWKAQMKEMSCKEPYPTSPGRCSVFSQPGSLIILVTLKDEVEDSHQPSQIISLLVHEAVHAWQYIRKEIGETDPGLEIEAYAIQWISQCLIEGFNHRRKKIA